MNGSRIRLPGVCPRRMAAFLPAVGSRRRNSTQRGRAAHATLAARRTFSLETLEPRQLLAANPIISEFLARNDGGLRDGDGRSSDWIEVYNSGDEPVDLAGYHLTDRADELSQWTFPSSVLDPGDYLLVFASGRSGPDFVDAQGNLHTNFTLKRGGEYVALVSPDGHVVSEFGKAGEDYPEQVTNVSYGMAQSWTLLDASSELTYVVPTDNSLGLSWTLPRFDAAAHGFVPGLAGLGFETRPTNRVNFTGHFETALPDGAHAVYARLEFEVNDGSAISDLLLRMKYDNGFAAYLNGVKVASQNAPENLGWFSSAIEGSRRDGDALEFVEFDLSEHTSALVSGTNVLAIHGLNNLADNSDMLLVPELHAGASDLLAASGTAARIGFMTLPTPGRPNVGNKETFLGVVADTKFSLRRGFYDTPQQVEITSETEGAQIYFTLDGNEPRPTAPSAQLYSGAIPITSTTVLRAAAFKDEFLPTNVDTQTYLFVADVSKQGDSPPGYPSEWSGDGGGATTPADYEMDPEITENPAYREIIDDALLAIPSLSIVTEIDNLFDPQTGIYQRPENHGIGWERPVSVELIFPDGTDGFQEDAGIRIQGGHTRRPSGSPKHSFRLRFRAEYGAGTLQYDWFGGDAVDEFDTIVLRAGGNQSWIHTNTFMGDNRGRAQYIRDQWAKDTLQAMGRVSLHNDYAHLYINGLYWGLYNPTERPTAAFAASYLGGDREDYDVLNAGVVLDGDNAAWGELLAKSRDDMEVDANYRAISEILDIDAYIDYMLLNHYAGNTDWDSHNWYAIHPRQPEGKFFFVPWDTEFIFINKNDNRLRVRDGMPGRLFNSLRNNEEFRMQFADQIQRHFLNEGVFTPASVLQRWEARSNQIVDAIVAESARWGDYRRDLVRRSGPFELLERDVHWMAERNRLLTDYFPERTDIVLQQFRDAGLFPATEAPRYSQHGGPVPRGYALSISNPSGAGTVYYTLDGTDPRLDGGDVAAGASVYDAAPLTIEQRQVVKSRVLNGTQWSPLSEAEFFISTPDSPFNLRISEINYHPHAANLVPGLGEAVVDSGQFEFIEFTNTSVEPIHVDGVQVTRALEFVFPAASVLAPGERVLVVKDRAAFESRYGEGRNIVGEFGDGQLSDTGDVIEVRDALGAIIQRVSYGLGTDLPHRSSGNGSTLEVIDSLINPGATASMRASSLYGGSPGTEGLGPLSPVIVSEVLAHSTPPRADLVELHNTTGAPIDLSNWYIGNSEALFAYQVPLGVVIPARGYHVFDQSQLGFSLNGGRGDEVWLLEADAAGRPIRFVDHAVFGPSAEGISLGPWPHQDGPLRPLAESTFGGENAGPRPTEVIISEVHYNPVDPDGRGIIRSRNLEFVELANQTDQAIDVGNWRLTGDTEFTFEPGTTIQPGQTLLVVGFDPRSGSEKIVFGFHFSVDPSVPIVGPFSERLDDDGALIRLERDGTPPVEEPDFTPVLLLDHVAYSDAAPWPTSPDQGGDSLTRVRPQTSGDLATAWSGQTPSPGAVNFVVRRPGDANEDGEFNQADIVTVLQGGKFLTGQPAIWSEGDWTGDGVFNQLDIVAALQTGTYLLGPLASVTGAETDRARGAPIRYAAAVDSVLEHHAEDLFGEFHWSV